MFKLDKRPVVEELVFSKVQIPGLFWQKIVIRPTFAADDYVYLKQLYNVNLKCG